MKKISIYALVLVLAASLTGCWRRKPAETTLPGTTAPMTHNTTPSTAPAMPSTAPTVPSTNGTVAPDMIPDATDSIVPDMTPDTDGGNNNDSNPGEANARRRNIMKY